MGSLEIPGEKGKFFLLPQKIAYDGFKNRSFSYSGPTSMGKTFLMTTFIKQRIDEGRDWNFAIIVPTKALINELKGEVIREFKNEILERNYRVISSANDLQLESEHKFILVMTPERLMYFLIKYRDIVLDYVFFDEAYKISEKDPRSSFYYKDISLLSKIQIRPTLSSLHPTYQTLTSIPNCTGEMMANPIEANSPQYLNSSFI